MGMKAAAAGLAFAVATNLLPAPGFAADAPTPQSKAPLLEKSVEHANRIRLAYILSPSDPINITTQKGLINLAKSMIKRTSVEPSDIVGLNIERDDLTLYPFIYWTVTPGTQPLSQQARMKVQSYLKNGGFIVFDLLTDNRQTIGSVMNDLGLRQLVPPPKDHTLFKSFFLMATLNGSRNETPLSVETQMSSVLVGSRNWAAAWAGQTVKLGSEEWEMTLRAGTNMVMYALSGDYKNDAVHIPTILEKLKP